MTELQPPMQQYTLGKLPSHSPSKSLGENFNVPAAVISSALVSLGYVDEQTKKITKKAFQQGVVDRCGKTFLWNLEQVERLLRSGGIKVKRTYANQHIKPNKTGSPQFVGMGEIARHFNVSSVIVGRWLTALGVREDDGLPTEASVKRGLAEIVTMVQKSENGTVKRQFGKWELTSTLYLLRDKGGHPLDFDYRASLQASGKNSAVTLSDVDSKATVLAQEVAELFNRRDKAALQSIVRRNSKLMLRKVEEKLARPGFLTSGQFLTYL